MYRLSSIDSMTENDQGTDSLLSDKSFEGILINTLNLPEKELLCSY